MNPFIKALRRLVPNEIKALLEKIDSLDTSPDSSYYHIKDFVRNANLTRLERFLLRDALHNIARHDTMARAMEIVIGRPDFASTLGGNLARGLKESINGTSAQLKSDMELSNELYQAALQARQAAVAQENLQRKKVVVRVRPAAQ